MKATVQSKGQIALPKEVRDELGLKPGDLVEWGRYGHGRWGIFTLDQLVEDLELGSGELTEWSRRAKKGLRPTGHRA